MIKAEKRHYLDLFPLGMKVKKKVIDHKNGLNDIKLANKSDDCQSEVSNNLSESIQNIVIKNPMKKGQ